MVAVRNPTSVDPPTPGRASDQASPRSVEVALAIPIGLACLAVRLVNLDRYSGSYPEGIRAEQLLLMAAGFRPFRDIFSDQGPWLLHSLYPGYVLLGGSLIGVRIAVVLASLIGLAAIYWVLRQLAGPPAGLVALALLGLSPLYLQFSRLAVAEVLALAPAMVALGCALRFGSCPRDRWLIAAAGWLALSLLIKPITLGISVPMALAVGLVAERRRRNLLVLGAATACCVLAGVVLVGLPEILQQIVAFRLASRGAEGWRLATNLNRFRAELAPEGVGLLALAALGAVFAPASRAAWPLLAWPVAAAATLLVHAPLHSKHFVMVAAPLAALAAYGGSGGLSWLRRQPLVGRRQFRLAAAGALAIYAAALGPLLSRDFWLLTSDDLFERDEARLWYPDAVETLRRVTGPSDFVVTDHAYLAYTAGRPVPPGLVEASATRVRAGSLTDATAIDQTQRYDARAVLLWADKLVDLKRFRTWLTEGYAPAKVWASEGNGRPVLWLRADGRLPQAREALRAGLQAAQPAAGSTTWRLAGSGLDRAVARPGDAISATLEWEPAGETPPDANVLLALRDASGRLAAESQQPLLGGLGRPRWLFWVGAVSIPAGMQPGDYRLTVALVDARGRALSAPADVGAATVLSP